jgi:hypothetical protein
MAVIAGLVRLVPAISMHGAVPSQPGCRDKPGRGDSM